MIDCIQGVDDLIIVWRSPVNIWLNYVSFSGFGVSYEPRHDKTNSVFVRPAKTQISLVIHPVWSESSLYTQWVAKDPSFLHADSEDSDETGRMARLIWVFAGHTLILLVLSCRGSYSNALKFVNKLIKLTWCRKWLTVLLVLSKTSNNVNTEQWKYNCVFR